MEPSFEQIRALAADCNIGRLDHVSPLLPPRSRGTTSERARRRDWGDYLSNVQQAAGMLF